MISVPNFIILIIHLLFTIASTGTFIFYVVDKLTTDSIGSDAIGYLIFGIMGLVFLTLLMRFFKIIITRKEKVYLIYPFLLWVRIIERKELIGFNTFQAEMIRHFNDFEFTLIKTKNNKEFIISNFLYWNYNRLFDNIITDNFKNDNTIQFWKIKHLYILIPLFVITLITVAILAS